MAQALALFLRSNFFFRFLMGVFFEVPGTNVCEIPGNSPSFQCLFLATEDEEEEVGLALFAGAANAQRTSLDFGFWVLGLVLKVVFLLRGS